MGLSYDDLQVATWKETFIHIHDLALCVDEFVLGLERELCAVRDLAHAAYCFIQGVILV